SRLYWINTTGAVAGTFAAGFLFLPTLGLKRTLAIAASLNLLAGALALWLGRAESIYASASASTAVQGRRNSGSSASLFLLICFAGVGATAMAYEIAWTRLLSTQLGSSTYAFTLMLGTFLTGIV